MFAELRDIFERIRLDNEVRCVILTGAGERAFTAGLDLQGALGVGSSGGEEGDSYRRARKVRETILQWQAAVNAVEGCGKRKSSPPG